MISFISSFETINVVCFAKSQGREANTRGRVPDPNIFLEIAASVADVVAVNPNVIKTFLNNGLSRFSIKGKSVVCNGPKSLPKNPPNCFVLYNGVFDNFILAEKLFAKAWQCLETCVLVNNNLCGKLLS